MFRGPTGSFKTSTTSIISSLMFLAARPDRIAESQRWDLIVPNCTSNDLHRGTFGKNATRAHPGGSSRGEGRTGSPVRMGGTYHPGRGPPLPPDIFNPHCFHVPWHVFSYLCGVTRSICNVTPRITSAHGHITISFPCICGAR